MRSISTLVVLATLSAHAAEPNTLTAEERAAGWMLLFDGRSFQGWQDPSRLSPPGRSWTIENGCLKAVARPGLREDLFTVQSFQDFELRFEWRISPGGNSGLKYRIQDRFFLDEKRLLAGEFKRFEDLATDSARTRAVRRENATQEYIVGFEYQVIDDSKHPDARRGGYYQAGALYDMLAVSSKAARAPGVFNEARVLVRGTHIEHWLNGVKVVDGDLAGPEIRERAERRWTVASPVYQALVEQPVKASPIALQNHDDEAWFRSLKIRRWR